MDKYTDRRAAGRVLAKALAIYQNKPNTLVLALPRGGVPVGYEIAKTLHLPLDVYIARKLGVPDEEELAMGAIAMGNSCVLNEEIIRERFVSAAAIEKVKQAEQQELERRVKRYRGNKAFPQIADHTIIIVDDGIATGATLRAVIAAIKAFHPAKIVVAVPVAERFLCQQIESLVDELICPLRPVDFNAVGSFYKNFEQTSDEEVIKLLALADLVNPKN